MNSLPALDRCARFTLLVVAVLGTGLNLLLQRLNAWLVPLQVELED